jgi:hypothetical protein
LNEAPMVAYIRFAEKIGPGAEPRYEVHMRELCTLALIAAQQSDTARNPLANAPSAVAAGRVLIRRHVRWIKRVRICAPGSGAMKGLC